MDDRATDRQEMIDRQIRRRGVSDPRVLEALAAVPRHLFVPESGIDRAYDDHPLPIGSDQTISQPYMVAAMTELLALTKESRVLEIGTGSGYQTAVLAHLAREVFTVERLPELSARARLTLTSNGYDNVRYEVRDGSAGWPEEGPFDGIIITAAAPQVPPSLVRQLADPGVLVAPVGGRGSQNLVTVRREHGEDVTRTHFKCSFVPLLGVEGFPD